jgi:hypothetical protein
MAMPVQKCPLCLQVKNVVSSHLWPAAVYDYCRSVDGESPVRVGDGVVLQTDRRQVNYLPGGGDMTHSWVFHGTGFGAVGSMAGVALRATTLGTKVKRKSPNSSSSSPE